MKARELVVAGLLAAALYLQQVLLSGIPNVQLCTPLIMIYTLLFPRQVLLIVATFVLLEGFTFGFGLWWFGYLYAWPLLVLLTWLLRRNSSVGLFAVLAGAFGLCFGALFAIPYFFIGGPAMAFSYWVAGIPFDIVHCIGNTVGTLLLWKPIYGVLSRLRGGMTAPTR